MRFYSPKSASMSDIEIYHQLTRLRPNWRSGLLTYAHNLYYSAGRDEDVPGRGRLGLLDAHVREACLHERGDNVVGRSQCKDVRWHSHAIHPLLRNESDGHTPARQKHPMDFGEPRVERTPEVDRIDGAYFTER